jgi:hypothetical protein
MRKGKVRLQKEISRIFTGVHIPSNDASGADTRPAAAAPDMYVPPKPVVPAPRTFTIQEPTEPGRAGVPKLAGYEPPAPVLPALRGLGEAVSLPALGSVEEANVLAPAPVSVRQPKPEPLHRPHRRTPFLKIWGQIRNKLFASQPGVNTTRQRAMILMSPVLAVVFIIALTQVLRTPVKPAEKSALSGTAGAFTGKIDWEPPPLYPETLRDPTKFSATFTQTRENSGRPVVKGIVYSEDNPRAVVGDRIVSAGDVVDGATVVKINPDSVEFAIGDKNWTQEVER